MGESKTIFVFVSGPEVYTYIDNLAFRMILSSLITTGEGILMTFTINHDDPNTPSYIRTKILNIRIPMETIKKIMSSTKQSIDVVLEVRE